VKKTPVKKVETEKKPTVKKSAKAKK
jgi:hypothetical protein